MDVLERALRTKYRAKAALETPAALLIPAAARSIMLDLVDLVVELAREVIELRGRRESGG